MNVIYVELEKGFVKNCDSTTSADSEIFTNLNGRIIEGRVKGYRPNKNAPP